MKIGIVTDSTCDLPANLVAQYGLEVVPAILVIEGQEYIDGKNISRDDFYRRLPLLNTPPTTAAPSLGDFVARYQAHFQRGCDHILSIHAAGLLTSILDTARQAAQEFGEHITCLDSGSLSLGLGFQVLAAAEAAEQGLQAALAAIESTRRRLRLSAALDTMKYLRRSGRVPAAVAALGGLLSIKPMIELSEGVVKAIGAVRTNQQAEQRMMQFLLESGPLQRLAILHTGAEERARKFLQTFLEKTTLPQPQEILVVNVTTLIGTHVGPNGLGFAAVRAAHEGV